jgi:hypothetical protein
MAAQEIMNLGVILRSHALLVWFFASVVCLLIMLTHESDSGEILGLYSLRYSLILLVMLVLTAAAGISSGLALSGKLQIPQLKINSRLRWGILAAGVALVAITWLFLPISSTSGGLVFRVYLVMLLFFGLLAIVERFPDLPVGHLGWYVLLVATLVLTALFTILYQDGYVPPSRYYDEGWLEGWSISLHNRAPGAPLDSMFPMRDPLVVAVSTRLSLYGMGYWLELFGVGLRQGRLYSAVLAWLALPFIYATTRRLYGTTAALGALAVAALLPLHHSYTYPTGWVALTNAMGLYFFISAREAASPHSQRLRHFLAGLTISFGFEGHAYAVAFAAGLGGVYTLEYAGLIWRTRSWQRNPNFWLFVLGVLSCAGISIIFRIWISGGLIGLGNLVDALRASYSVQTTIGGQSEGLIWRIWNANASLYGDYFLRYPLEFTLLVIGILAALRRFIQNRNSSDRILLAILALSLLVFALVLAKANVYYWIFLMPFIAALSGAFIAQFGRTKQISGFVPFAASIMIVAMMSVFTIKAAGQGQNVNQLLDVSDQISELLPDEVETVAGWETYYMGMYPRQFIATSSFYGFDQMIAPGTLAPDAIILTAGLDDVPATLAYLEANHLQRAYCFPTGLFDGMTILYLRADLLPQDAPLLCDES